MHFDFADDSAIRNPQSAIRLLGCVVAVALLCLSCKPSPKLVWKFKAGADIHGSPVLAGKLLIATSVDSFVYALDSQTGNVVWKKNLGSPLFSTPVLEGSTLFLGTGEGDFLALEAATGTVLWTIPTEALIEYTPCMDEKSLYFGNSAGSFYRVTKQGGIIWKTSLGRKVSGSCGLYQDLLYTSCWDKNFHALRRSNGETSWKQPSGTLNFSGPSLQDGAVYFASHEQLFAFDALSGAIRFKKETAYGNHVIVWNRSLWTSDSTGLIQRDLNGNPINRITLPLSAGFCPLIQDDLIIVGDNQRTLHGISPQLEILWKFKGKDLFTGPGIVGNGIYYVGDHDGNIYAIRLPN